MSKDIYKVTLDLEREAFDPMTDEQWQLFEDKMDGEGFDEPFAIFIETAMEIEASIRENS